MNRIIIAWSGVLILGFICVLINLKTKGSTVKIYYVKLMSNIKQIIINCRACINNRIGHDELTLAARVFKKDLVYKVLIQQLEKAYRTKDVWNIAIIGEKGVGKTSFIKTFEASHTLPLCKYLYVSIANDYVTKKDDVAKESVEIHIIKQILARARQRDIPETAFKLIPEKRKRPTLCIVLTVLIIGIWVLILNYEKWNILRFIEKMSYAKDIMYILAIMFSCVDAIMVGFKIWNRFEMKSVKIGKNNFGTELGQREKLSLDDYLYEVIYVLKVMRWKIGHTVVIEDMGLLDDDECLRLFSKLKMLNKNLNNNILTYRFFNITGIARPIRFLYVFRNNISEKVYENKFFQETIVVPNRVERHNFADIVNDLLQSEAKKRNFDIELVEHLRFDSEYLYNLAEHLSNYRDIYSVIKNFYSSWDVLSLRLKTNNRFIDDAKRLFSFTVYSYIFPLDRAKFGMQQCLASSGKDRSSFDSCEIYDKAQRDLLWYLINECPEPYRINYLCKRFENINYAKADQYIEQMKAAMSCKNYEWALHCIELALCCKPYKADYYKWHSEILRILHRDSEITFDIFQEKRLEALRESK